MSNSFHTDADISTSVVIKNGITQAPLSLSVINSTYVAIGLVGGDIWLYDRGSGRGDRDMHDKSESNVWCLVCDGKYLFAGYGNGKIAQWDWAQRYSSTT